MSSEYWIWYERMNNPEIEGAWFPIRWCWENAILFSRLSHAANCKKEVSDADLDHLSPILWCKRRQTYRRWCPKWPPNNKKKDNLSLSKVGYTIISVFEWVPKQHYLNKRTSAALFQVSANFHPNRSLLNTPLKHFNLKGLYNNPTRSALVGVEEWDRKNAGKFQGRNEVCGIGGQVGWLRDQGPVA